MTRYLTFLGVALAAVVTAAALTTSDAGAMEEETISAYYMVSELGTDETAEIDGEQIGTTTSTLTIGSLPALTCSTIEYDGEAGDIGPIFEEPVEIEPVYSACHVIAPVLGTRTATVTVNDCTYDIGPTGTVTEGEETHFVGDLDIACPEGKEIEIHVYNTGSSNDSGASTLCTFSVPAQSELSGITLTNSEGDIVADFDVGSIQVERTGGAEGICGPASQTATYKGEATLSATNEAEEFVEFQTQAKKLFRLGQANATVIGDQNGGAEFTTSEKTIKCTTVKYEASPKANEVGELTITPGYSNCKLGALTAHVDFKSCKYFHTLLPDLDSGPITTASVEITCQNADKLTITVTNANNEPKCTITYAGQKMTGHVGLKNNEVIAKGDPKKWWVKFTNTLGGLSYEITGEEAICGKAGSFTLGTLHGALDVRAYDDIKKSNQKGIRVFGNSAHNKGK